MKFAYTYDDVALARKRNNSIQEVDYTTRIGNLLLKLPVLSAPMDTLTNGKFAIALAKVGAVGVIHKNFSLEKQCLEVEEFRQIFPKNQAIVGAAVGVSGIQFENKNPSNLMLERAKALVNSGVDFLVVDTGHGHTKRVIESVQLLKQHLPLVPLIAGNVVTAAGTLALINAGVDAVKVGIGGGSICTTRVVAGVGVPQLSAIRECVKVARERGIPIIADGGIRDFEDVAKSFAAGASCVMMGSFFAATKESAGNTVVVGNKEYKYYRGMGTKKAMKLGAAERYSQENAKNLVAEGIEALREVEGSVIDKLKNFEKTLRKFMQENGCKNLADFQEKLQLTLLNKPPQFNKTTKPEELLLVPNFSLVVPTKTNVTLSWEKLQLLAPLLIKTPSKIVIFSKEEKGVFLETQIQTQEEFLKQEWKTKNFSVSQLLFVEFSSRKIQEFKQKIEEFKNKNSQIMLGVCVKNYEDALQFINSNVSAICVNESLNETSVWLAKKLSGILAAKKKVLIIKSQLKPTGDFIKMLALGTDLIMLDTQKEETQEALIMQAEEIKRGLALGLAYCGAANLKEFKTKAVLIAQSSAGVTEAAPHSVLEL